MDDKAVPRIMGHHSRGHPLNKVQDYAEWKKIGDIISNLFGVFLIYLYL